MRPLMYARGTLPRKGIVDGPGGKDFGLLVDKAYRSKVTRRRGMTNIELKLKIVMVSNRDTLWSLARLSSGGFP